MEASEEMMAAPPPEPTPSLREYVVTLHHQEDLDEFYNDMETEGGNLYIPNRAVEVSARKTISRNTHYMLSPEEVETIRNDPRVRSIEPTEFLGLRLPKYTIENGIFNKTDTDNNTHTNWALLACLERTNRSNWGFNGTTSYTTNSTISSSGKNVDVVIIDGHINPDHPEFAVNADGTGGSRVIQYNWFQHTAELGLGANGTYVYTPYIGTGQAIGDNSHGTHVAGTVAGNTQGWARNANIYNINPYGTNPNGSLAYLNFPDYIRAWHNSKPVNPATGRKNPTIVNMSFGISFTFNYNGSYTTGPVTRVVYRGVDFNPGRSLTVAEMNARGFYGNTNTSNGPTVPYLSTSDVADYESMIDDGILIVGAAGNDYFKIDVPGGTDYNNIFYATYGGINYSWYLHRGGAEGLAGISVGAISHYSDERKANFSNCGPGVEIFAPGYAILSAVNTNLAFGGTPDARNPSYYVTKIQGTSMASPQVCGVLACLMETYPNLTQTEAIEWLLKWQTADRLSDTNTDDATDVLSLQGAPNRYLFFKNERYETGNSYPKVNFKPRPTSGAAYPRPRIRRKG